MSLPNDYFGVVVVSPLDDFFDLARFEDFLDFFAFFSGFGVSAAGAPDGAGAGSAAWTAAV